MTAYHSTANEPLPCPFCEIHLKGVDISGDAAVYEHVSRWHRNKVLIQGLDMFTSIGTPTSHCPLCFAKFKNLNMIKSLKDLISHLEENHGDFIVEKQMYDRGSSSFEGSDGVVS